MVINNIELKAPFPYFGGKSQIADDVWRIFGHVKRYIEPFFGSGAMLWKRPDWKEGADEIVNDASCHIANVWRAIKHAPDEVANECDFPTNHAELIARKKAIMDAEEGLAKKIMTDVDYYDVRLAGFFVWCMSNSIDYNIINKSKKRPQLTSYVGIMTTTQKKDWLNALSFRLADVKVTCGDWLCPLGGNWQSDKGTCAVFLDPPYGDTRRKKDLYMKDSYDIAEKVLEWCKKRGNEKDLRIVLCGYDTEYDALLADGWQKINWKAQGGLGNQKKTDVYVNATMERLWINPACIENQKQLSLF